MITLTIHVIARAASRSTSYNVKDIERALCDSGLEPVRNTYLDSEGKSRVSLIFTAEQSYEDRDATLAARNTIETALKRVHRNVSYRFEFSGV